MIRATIVGGTGYTGVELLRLLVGHPEVEIAAITSRNEDGRAVTDLFPNLRGHLDLCFSAPSATALLDCDVIFFATPHGVAQAMMADYDLFGSKRANQDGPKIIDLSADFRIKDIALWQLWYGQTHACPELVKEAVYGLPEVNREFIKQARLIACPGCYPTSIQLGLLPLLEKGLVKTSTLIANSASGITGAGRSAKLESLFAEAGDSFKPYGVSGHRHLPEIEQGLKLIAGEDEALRLTFVPHLLPLNRGILSTLYAQLKTNSAVNLQELYEDRYAREAFVDVLPANVYPQTRSVRGTNRCQIAISKPQQRDTVVIMSTIDNLNKGAAGQAVQNMNLMFNFDESCGLDSPGLIP